MTPHGVGRCPKGAEGTGAGQAKPHKIHLLFFSDFINRRFLEVTYSEIQYEKG